MATDSLRNPAPGTSTQSTLSAWAGPYVTDMLGKAQAISETPYQTYQGPMTAGTSGLQTQAFQGIGSLAVPSSIGEAATRAGTLAQTPSTTAYTPGTFGNQYTAPAGYSPIGGSVTDTGVAQRYMNPYLEQALAPTIDELRRQSQITQMQNAAKFAGAGAFGGSRQALADTETQRNLLNQIARTTGEGYSSAYDKALTQYNAEQARKIQEAQFGTQQEMTAAETAARYGLAGQQAAEQAKQFGVTSGLDALSKQIAATQLQGQLGQMGAEQERANLAQMLGAGTAQRGIEQEGITADYNEFLAQRDYPMKQVQFLQSMLQGLPIATYSTSPAAQTGIGQLASTVGTLGTTYDLLKKLGVV